MNKTTVIIGATSAIALAMARELAKRGDTFFLIARNQSHLKTVAEDIAIRSQQPCKTMIFDALAYKQADWLVSEAVSALGEIDRVIIAHGLLPDQCQWDVEKSVDVFQINATSYIALATAFSNQLKKQQSGMLVLFSSCAGDRGRASNYLYGSAKAAVSIFSEGLRADLYQYGVHVMTVKPGWVDTPMTQSFKKGLLWASPEPVARRVIKAMDQKKSVVYAPFFWRYIMWVIRLLPEGILRKLK